MTAAPFMQSPLWLTAGWVMLHFVWVGGAIGVFAAAGRWLLRSAPPHHRYAFALWCFMALAVSPLAVAARLSYDPPQTPVPTDRSFAADEPVFDGSIHDADLPAIANSHETLADLEPPRPFARLGLLASSCPRYLPWLWLIGAPVTLLTAAAGRVGVERLKRQSRQLGLGELPTRCRRLAAELGIRRAVAIRVCERLTTSILVGVLRPLILLPPAALTGWSMEQVEMVLLHELAHVRRWDPLVNLTQRIVEAVLFFHPVVWWMSAWLRLERELCCDRIVIAHTGRPREYAAVLAGLATAEPAAQAAALAMAEHNLVTRIRSILKPEDRTMKASVKALILAAALPIAAVIALGFYARHSRVEGATPPAPVAGEPPQNKGAEPNNPVLPAPDKGTGATLKLPGEIEAYQQVEMHSRIAGYVEKVNADIGDRVKKGQVLAEISAPELEAEYRQKQAGIQQAKAEVEAAAGTVRASQASLQLVKVQIAALQSEVKRAQADLTFRKTQMVRMEELLKNRAVDQRTVDEARERLEAAKAAVETAEAKLLGGKAAVDRSLAKLAKTEADRKVAEAKLLVAEADVQRAAVMVRFTRIQAPFDAVVVRRGVQTGDFAPPAERAKSEPLFVLARTDMLRVIVRVGGDAINRLRVGTPAVIRIDAYADKDFEAKVSRIAGAIDRTNRTLRAEIDLPNSEGRILPGMTGQVLLRLEK